MSGLMHKWNWNSFKRKKDGVGIPSKGKKYGLIYAVSAHKDSFTLHKCHNSLEFLN